MKETLLNSLIESQHPAITAIVEAWEATGNCTLEMIVTEKVHTITPGQIDCLVEPIQLNGETIGWLQLKCEKSKSLHARLKSDAQMISTILQQECEIEKMTSELIDQQDQLMALHQLAQVAGVQSNFQQTLSSLARVAARLLKTEGAFMQLLITDREPLFAAYPAANWAEDLWHELLESLDIKSSHDPKLSRNQKSSKNQWLLQQGDPALKQLRMPVRNLLMQKVNVRSDVSFVLGVINKETGQLQTPDIKLLSTIAEPASATIENALLQHALLDQTRIQTEMELAKQVQMRLLPRQAPQIPGVDIAVQTRPAFQVGGDFYDYLLDNKGLLTSVVGDVSGKGMPAALLMTMLRTVLRGKTMEIAVAAPELILDCANRHLYSDFSEVDMFATVFLSQYDIFSHQLHYANQGHSPVIFRPSNGAAALLTADAPPLGVLPQSLAQHHSITLQPGDLVVIASDGFSEAERKDGEMFGNERLLLQIDQLAALPATELLAQLFQNTQAFSAGHPQSDDQTMLVLKRT